MHPGKKIGEISDVVDGGVHAILPARMDVHGPAAGLPSSSLAENPHYLEAPIQESWNEITNRLHVQVMEVSNRLDAKTKARMQLVSEVDRRVADASQKIEQRMGKVLEDKLKKMEDETKERVAAVEEKMRSEREQSEKALLDQLEEDRKIGYISTLLLQSMTRSRDLVRL